MGDASHMNAIHWTIFHTWTDSSILRDRASGPPPQGHLKRRRSKSQTPDPKMLHLLKGFQEGLGWALRPHMTEIACRLPELQFREWDMRLRLWAITVAFAHNLASHAQNIASHVQNLKWMISETRRDKTK